MHPKRKQRLLLITALVVGVSIAVGLILYSLSSGINLFYPPADIAAGKAPLDKRIRVGGMVVPGSVKRDETTLKVSFKLTDYDGELAVSFEGILPDLFAENEGAVAAGYLQEDGSFVADEVLAKHDENYMPPEVMETLKQPNASYESKP